MSLPREFASDNTAPVHPAVLEALGAANQGPSHAYGKDSWTARAIEWSNGGVVVRADGLVVRAARAIVAVPPPLAAEIAFTPALPTSRAALHAGMPMGAAGKCFAIYDEAFWRKDIDTIVSSAWNFHRRIWDAAPIKAAPGG